MVVVRNHTSIPSELVQEICERIEISGPHENRFAIMYVLINPVFFPPLVLHIIGLECRMKNYRKAESVTAVDITEKRKLT